MAYAAYRDPPGATHGIDIDIATFEVLDATVSLRDAGKLRRAFAACDGVGLLRCEPLLHRNASADGSGPRARLTVRFATPRYADVLRCILECVPGGEIGPRLTWHAHLARRVKPIA